MKIVPFFHPKGGEEYGILSGAGRECASKPGQLDR